jgi:hypothetical protein
LSGHLFLQHAGKAVLQTYDERRRPQGTAGVKSTILDQGKRKCRKSPQLHLVRGKSFEFVVSQVIGGPYGDPDRIRTCDQQLRRLLLYPAELRDRTETPLAHLEQNGMAVLMN